jgi:hypothetical protein
MTHRLKVNAGVTVEIALWMTLTGKTGKFLRHGGFASLSRGVLGYSRLVETHLPHPNIYAD